MQSQVKTHKVKISTIMRSAAFMRGFMEVRKGLPMDYDAYSKDIDLHMRWSYERGRQFALVHAGDVKDGRTVRIDAVMNWVEFGKKKFVI